MKLADRWYKAASAWLAVVVAALPNIAGALMDLAPFLGPYGQTVITIAGLMIFIARVYPQKAFENDDNIIGDR